MGVGAGEDCCAGGRADAVVDVAVVEAHSFLGEAVEVRGVVYAGAIAGESFAGVVVGHDEEDVRSCGRGSHCRFSFMGVRVFSDIYLERASINFYESCSSTWFYIWAWQDVHAFVSEICGEGREKVRSAVDGFSLETPH